MVTYGDGVADVDLRGLLDFHQRTATRDGDRRPARSRGSACSRWTTTAGAQASHEKPQLDGWVNAGFFVFDRRVLRLPRRDDDCILEREPLERLARKAS